MQLESLRCPLERVCRLESCRPHANRFRVAFSPNYIQSIESVIKGFMEDERKWTAVAGRLEMKTFMTWIAIANALFILTVCVSAAVVFVGMKLDIPFGLVRAFAILVFGGVIFLAGRGFKKAFDATRHDLQIEIENDHIIFKKQGKPISETSLIDPVEFLMGPTNAMGLAFPTGDDQPIRIGCFHPSMSWKDGAFGRFDFELEPSDFIRLVGELGLEDNVETRSF